MHYFFKILVLIVGYRNEVVFANVVGTSPVQQTEAPVTVTCPIKNTQILHPALGLGSMECTDLEKDKNRCQKYASVTCVGTKTSITGKCYDWHCYNLPKNGDYVLEINGPKYNKIDIRIQPMPPVWVVLVCLGIFFLGFVIAPEFMFGFCIGNSWGDDNTYSFSS